MRSPFKKGQTVYIQGKWKAVVHHIDAEGHVSCDVYEGLGEGMPVPSRFSYEPMFIEPTKRISKK